MMWPHTPLLSLTLKQSIKNCIREKNRVIPFVTSGLTLQGDLINPV